MKNRDRIGLELNPKIIRGVRVGRRPKAVEIPVEENHEADALQKAIAQLGGNASIRLVLRGLGVSTTRLLRQSPDQIGSISEQIPIPERDATWHTISLSENRTLLLAAQRRKVEETLDGWGFPPSSRLCPDAVGLTLAALIALEPELETDRDLVWIDSPRMLHMRRESGRIMDASAPQSGAIPKGAILCGPGAWEAAQSNPGCSVFRPGGFDSSYSLAWGAAHWGGESVPELPNLEPRERREWRARARQERVTQRRALLASLALLLAGSGAYGFAWSNRTSALEERAAAQSMYAAAESELQRVSESVASRGSSGSSRGDGLAVSQLIAIVARHTRDIFLTELSIQLPAGRFAALGSNHPEHRLRGRARTLDSVEALRSDLAAAGFKSVVEEATETGRAIETGRATETARPTFTVDFFVTAK